MAYGLRPALRFTESFSHVHIGLTALPVNLFSLSFHHNYHWNFIVCNSKVKATNSRAKDLAIFGSKLYLGRGDFMKLAARKE